MIKHILKILQHLLFYTCIKKLILNFSLDKLSSMHEKQRWKVIADPGLDKLDTETFEGCANSVECDTQKAPKFRVKFFSTKLRGHVQTYFLTQNVNLTFSVG